jgi:CubicO group peptidase (beta-lactamase class C family)
LIGAAVVNATGQSLSAYLSEKIWGPFGIEKDGFWILSPEGLETGGICFSACLRDFGHLGAFMLGGGRVDGKSVLPEGWLREATCRQVESEFGSGYGYHWWIKPKDAFQAMGIMGQSLVVDPTRSLVIVIQSAWETHGSPADYQLQSAFIEAVQNFIGEGSPPAAGG